MLKLDPRTLAQMTGEELLQLLQQQPDRMKGDFQTGSHVWRAFQSRERRKGVFLVLWRQEPTGSALPRTIHVRGLVTERIGEMRPVEG